MSDDLMKLVKEYERELERLKCFDIPAKIPYFKKLDAPLTSVAWAGALRSTTAKTLLDLSATFGVPSGVYAILVRIAATDTGSAAATDLYALLSPNSTATKGSVACRPNGITNGAFADSSGIVPCDANGDVYYQIKASGVNSMAVYLEIWGYWTTMGSLTQVPNSWIFGTGADYAMFESDGTLRLVGNATAWDDLRISGEQTRPGSTAPALGTFGPSGGLKVLHFETGHDDEAHFSIQMPHNWKQGSRIYPHVHWAPVSATAGNVVWELEYSWANDNTAFGAPSTMATDATAAGGTAWVHKLTQFKSGGNTYIDGTGKTMSSMLVCRIHRNAGVGSDTLAADVAFLEVDFHYEIDSLGSAQEYVK